MKKTAITIGVALAMLAGSIAPAQAAYGDLSNCKTSYTRYAPFLVWKTIYCDMETSVPGVKVRVKVYSGRA